MCVERTPWLQESRVQRDKQSNADFRSRQRLGAILGRNFQFTHLTAAQILILEAAVRIA
jgi:hypothetical protein